MKKLLLFLFVMFLSACGSTLSTPAWQNNASAFLEDYKINFLSGKEAAGEPHFFKARREIASGNDLNLLTIAYLTKYALHAASLESFDTADFARLYRLEPNPANMAYCHFLKGNFSAVDAQVFPPLYAGVLKAALSGNSQSGLREISAITDPLSRLVACGVWVRYLPHDEQILQIAIQTASANGWRRPLWAFLEKLQNYYTSKNEPGKAETIRLRLELLRK